MKLVILSILSISACLAETLPSHWENFKLTHGKSYDHPLEEAHRFNVFSENLKKIAEHNVLYDAGLVSYKKGLNKFADMTSDEFKQYLGLSGARPAFKKSGPVLKASENIHLPASIDYRQKNVVNAVKDQGQCGSCWAFSTVGALESISALKTGELLSLSEQNLVDCSSSYGNYGCNGGLMEYGYNYIKANGIEAEAAYPYTARDGSCQFNKTKSVLTVSGHTNIESGSESALQTGVATKGPVAVAVDATEWQFYNGGIFSTSGYYQLNHGVVAVGYGTESGQDYWIVRNSWGQAWGEQGYIRVARNKNNQVGISDEACYPTL